MFSHFLLSRKTTRRWRAKEWPGVCKPRKKHWKHLQVPCFPNKCERHVVVVVVLVVVVVIVVVLVVVVVDDVFL